MISPELPRETALRLARWGFDDRAEVGELSLIREGPRSRVFRVEIEGSKAATTAILKEITDEGACGFTDWASLQWLSWSGGCQGLAPNFMAGDAEARCFLIEDLGPSRTLDDLLQGSDAAASVEALEALARAYARLHTQHGRERDWLRFRNELPAAENLGRAAEAERWLAGQGRLKEWSAALGMSRNTIPLTAMRPVARSYRSPGPFLAFTHGDPAPSNNHLSPAGVRLVDFEYGGFRHALYDLTAWYILCPLPEPIVARMVASYRAEVEPHRPELAGDAFDTGWAEMCVYRALAMLTWISPEVLEQNRPWVGDWTAREALLVALGRGCSVAAPHPHLGPLAAFAEAMFTQLEIRWPAHCQAALHFPGLVSRM